MRENVLAELADQSCIPAGSHAAMARPGMGCLVERDMRDVTITDVGEGPSEIQGLVLPASIWFFRKNGSRSRVQSPRMAG